MQGIGLNVKDARNRGKWRKWIREADYCWDLAFVKNED